MRIRDEATKKLPAVCWLVFSAGMVCGSVGTAAAQGFSGYVDFCSTQRVDYGNTFSGAGQAGDPCPPAANGVVHTAGANPSAGRDLTAQTTGLFTDVNHTSVANATYPRPPEINACNKLSTSIHPEKCALHFFGVATGNQNDLWVTLIGAPGTTPPTASCWSLKASVFFENDWNNEGNDNARGVGFVTNYSGGKGLYFGLDHGGNTNFMHILAFDLANMGGPNQGNENDCSNPAANRAGCYEFASTGLQGSARPMINVIGQGNQYLGNIVIAPEYVLQLNICTSTSVPNGTGTNVLVSAIGSVQPAASPYKPGTCPNDYAPDQYCLTYQGYLPNKTAASGIGASGAAGIASYTNGSSVSNTWVSKFQFVGTDQNPD